MEEKGKKNRISLIGIIVEDRSCIARLNSILSDYQDYIIGRMGIPHRGEEKGISLISIGIEAPESVISALSGKIGMLSGISAKVIYAKK